MQKEIECIIKGRVQMVMYRDFVRRKAKSLGLSGMVKNFEDGSVRVIAQGDEDKLKKFLEFLKIGPIFAKVAYVDTKWTEAKEIYKNFKIIY
ncbi:acylphosphatase [Candidatus Campbellbacteria bacterium CG10_big_fil_rev_8_21_14_0_10_35_52]|uniref:acylphosphatase n=1 Tax=Candidatus Campbellbacteria bacterium CG10_big_fil_rev_8_21_14_0_10_35_52 TaxID=1974527 RepID=A0A2M6WV72_9BACT|nr:MAG: acylphosphatase [Candidatus Campbellbacteria bacterium CG10_big_fil_rev_8_21_14_0_10_35_52]